MRKFTIILMLLVLVLGSCAKATQSSKVKVTFWHGLSGPLGDVLTDMIIRFNRSQNEVEVVANPISSYTALSQKLMASIQAGKQPDIAQVFESWTSKYVASDVLVNISDLIANDPDFTDEYLQDIYPVFLQSITYQDSIWSWPFNKSVRAYFYNKDMFYRAGLDPNHFPATWEEFRQYCRIFTRKAEPRNTYGTNYVPNEWQFINLLSQAGGRIVDENGTPVFNSPEGVEALTYLTDLLHKDKSVYQTQAYDGQNDFMAGIVSMYEGSSVSITHMRQQPINFNIGYAPLPTYRTKKSAISGANIVIFKSGDKRREEAAWKFIKWFTDTEQTAEWSARTCYMPLRKSALKTDILRDFLSESPQFEAIFAQLEDAIVEP
ncbi:MAG TPA: ABC transporter substrate-binding protein, partial [Candidatus Cloacimonas sp.]|nr:ABC transporter substrate-binding protein [Candidatus Cloacimonas sp.]